MTFTFFANWKSPFFCYINKGYNESREREMESMAAVLWMKCWVIMMLFNFFITSKSYRWALITLIEAHVNTRWEHCASKFIIINFQPETDKRAAMLTIMSTNLVSNTTAFYFQANGKDIHLDCSLKTWMQKILQNKLTHFRHGENEATKPRLWAGELLKAGAYPALICRLHGGLCPWGIPLFMRDPPMRKKHSIANSEC